MKTVLAIFTVLVIAGSAFLWIRSEKKQKHTSIPFEEKPFVVIIPSYNNVKYCEQNLLSVLNKNYGNFRIIYIDDCSTDGTYEKVSRLVNTSSVTLIRNAQNQGSLRNLYTALHTCQDDEIAVLVDGDDFLAHDGVLKRLNKIYQDPEVWATYGNYLDYPTYKQKPKICAPYPKGVIRANSYRSYRGWMLAAHLRSFKASLFKKIALADLQMDGKFLPMAGDLAFMLPILEMSGKHTRFIDEVLYLYNRANPLNDHKRDLALQSRCAAHIRSLKPYQAL